MIERSEAERLITKAPPELVGAGDVSKDQLGNPKRKV
jgi:hypothetical protein